MRYRLETNVMELIQKLRRHGKGCPTLYMSLDLQLWGEVVASPLDRGLAIGYFWVNPSIVITGYMRTTCFANAYLFIWVTFLTDFYVGFRKKNPILREEVLACSVFARFISIENIFIENLLEFKIIF